MKSNFNDYYKNYISQQQENEEGYFWSMSDADRKMKQTDTLGSDKFADQTESNEKLEPSKEQSGILNSKKASYKAYKDYFNSGIPNFLSSSIYGKKYQGINVVEEIDNGSVKNQIATNMLNFDLPDSPPTIETFKINIPPPTKVSSNFVAYTLDDIKPVRYKSTVDHYESSYKLNEQDLEREKFMGDIHKMKMYSSE